MSPNLLNVSRPSVPRYLLLAVILTAIWVVLAEGFLHISAIALESTPMPTRLRWWLLPPFLVLSLLFAIDWRWRAMQAHAETVRQQQALATQQQADAQALAALGEAKLHQQFALEVRGLGVAVDRFRQTAIWQELDKVNHPYKTILSQNAQDYEGSTQGKEQNANKRQGDAFEYALRGWVERWPIPVIVIGPPAGDKKVGIADEVGISKQSAGLALHLFIVAEEAQTDYSSALLGKLFDFFDQHQELPAAVVFSIDGSVNRSLFRSPGFKNEYIDGYFVPSMPDAMVAFVVTRTDRVNRNIRPYAVDTPYDMHFDPKYDPLRLSNFLFDQENAYSEKPEARGSDTLPWQYWQARLPEVLKQMTHYNDQDNMLPFWEKKPMEGFKSNPWVPIRWTKWQLEEEYDAAPLLGYLHRPVAVKLTDEHGQPLSESAKARAMAAGWQQALATLPDGKLPQRLFYDTGKDAKHIIPFNRAMNTEGTPHPLGVDAPKDSYNIGRRIGDTGASSPFVQIALGLMRSYSHGGVSATLDLRHGDTATITMVRPPSKEEKAHNRSPDAPFATYLEPQQAQ